MVSTVQQYSCVVLGEQSLLIQSCELLRERGHRILAVVAQNPRIRDWCHEHRIPCHDDFEALREVPSSFDYLFSITNLKMLPDWLLQRPARLAINFHDGPLPRYAGLNAPVWALLEGERDYGICWHEMLREADTGPLLVGRHFSIDEDATVLALNALCYQMGLDAFQELLERLESNSLEPQPQDLSQRRYFGLAKRPPAAALLDWRRPAAQLLRVIRALDFGPYPNPMALPKVDLGGIIVLAREAELTAAPNAAVPAAVLACDQSSLTVCCGDQALRITRLTDLNGQSLDVTALLQTLGLAVGDLLPVPDTSLLVSLEREATAVSRFEEYWRRALLTMEALPCPYAHNQTGASSKAEYREHEFIAPVALSADRWISVIGLLLARLMDQSRFTLAYRSESIGDVESSASRFFSTLVPLSFEVDFSVDFDTFAQTVSTDLQRLERHRTFLSDLPARDPALRDAIRCETLPVRILRSPLSEPDASGGNSVLTWLVDESGERVRLVADTNRLPDESVERLLGNLQQLLIALSETPDIAVAELNLLSENDRAQSSRVQTGEKVSVPDQLLHQGLERGAAEYPERIACVFQGQSLSYRQLNQSANRLAHYLLRQGVNPGDRVGIMLARTPQMLVALYAVLKSGAAYVPLDPVYPRERLQHMMEDAGLTAVICQREAAESCGAIPVVAMDELEAELRGCSEENPVVDISGGDLAYLIYTSGSTGKPKGVMIEHRNVANFFAGMDRQLEGGPGVWLAVTSISFDISVLELFWTLARGLTVVLYSGVSEIRRKAAAGLNRSMDFGLFYWNVANDESDYDQEKYRLLLEGARFADSHGFNAVWTPERHFSAFGGLFPNPSVTSAALATITQNVALRAGSCVVPLHSPIRIAEEWAVVDNLSGGRVGMSIAAGWAPPDFAIKPENFANAKQVMFESAEILRRLWRGETVDFPGPNGTVAVRTLPRPLQAELPLWVTTAGNIETFIQAGTMGANLLTHLLGQTVEEVAEKVQAYRQAWREAGHAGHGTVTLMLHTFVGTDIESVEKAVKQPLKDYLKSAMFLVKAAAWQFPTFKKMSEEQGKTLDEFFTDISDDDMNALLEFAFQRYFHTSGLFGTPDSCKAMVERVQRAGVDEIACLIDFGIETDVVLQHLPFLNELRESCLSLATYSEAEGELESLPELMQRYQVTHLQCTPTMATMLAADPEARDGLANLRQLMVGGEAFPPELARTLRRLVGGRVTNMYGPTETTIWSTVADVSEEPGSSVSIGKPLINQNTYILDRRLQPLPPGLVGELVIGGAGVVRGYWQRPELTDERFVIDPFVEGGEPLRMYRTGDLARFRPDGSLECLGRVDHQVKIRGYRVELGEIEALLRNHETVREAAVILREDNPGDQRLVAYLRPAEPGKHQPELLRDWLKEQLPEFMLPSAFVVLPSLPLTPNGKLDRKALPQPRSEQKQGQQQSPQNAVEAQVAAIWQQALAVDSVGVRDNFFDIGGHSLLVIQVLKAMREQFERPLQMTDLFKYTTVESLARFVAEESTVSSESGSDRGRARAEARRAALRRRRR